MRIVVSGTHAAGKSTLIADLVALDPSLEAFGDPYEDVDGERLEVGAGLFVAQFEVAEERLVALEPERHAVVERGPLDLLAYLAALGELGRSRGAQETVRRLAPGAAAAMSHVDLVVLVTLDPAREIWVDQDEDPELRDAMQACLLELVDDPDLIGVVPVVEVSGDRAARVEQVRDAIARLSP